MALLHRGVKEGLRCSTLLYAPEVKLYSMQVLVDRNTENLFAAGDGAGLSKDM